MVPRKCQRISDTEYDNMEYQFCSFSFCSEKDKTDINHWSETKVFLRYIADVVRTVRGDTKSEQRKGYNLGVVVKQQKKTEKQQFILQYRGNIFNEFVKNLNKIHPVQTIFTTRKLTSCLASFKYSLYEDLKSQVIFDFTCNGCNSIYVGHTWQHITTRN